MNRHLWNDPAAKFALGIFVVCTAVLGLLAFSGCTLWPSDWRLGKTPLEKAAQRQEQATAANTTLLKQAQRDVHQAETVFSAAPVSRPVEIGRGLLADARASIDQALGAPTVEDDASWRDFAIRLLSEKLEVRVKAEQELAAQRRETMNASERADRAVAAAWKSKQQALAYAADREELADFAGKLKLGFFALIGLLVLGTLLSVVARFVPALGLAAKVINGVAAPAITYAAHRAETGLQAVGTGMARLRQIAGDGAEALIERAFDGPVDADQKRFISSGALAAGNPPPTP